ERDDLPSRLRWWSIGIQPSSLRGLAREMERASYGPKRPWGFRLEFVRDDHISGRYIERVEWIETVVDPLGESVDLPRIDFRIVAFRLATTEPSLELANPPRSCKAFFTRLAEFLDFKVAISPITIGPS